MGSTDAELIRAAARGDRQALAELYDRHAPPMLAVALRILGNRREAEDLVHDAFLEAWAHAGDYDPERSSVKTWLLLRVRSRCVDVIRSAARSRTDPLEEDERSSGHEAEGAFVGDEGRVAGLLAELPDTQREVLVLAYFEDLSMSEIAERLGVPIGTVKSRAARALAQMKECLKEGATDS